MCSLAGSCSPTSYHFNSTFKFRKSPTPLFLRTRILTLDRRFRVLCAAQSNEQPAARRIGNSWAETSSDWFGGEQYNDESQQKRELPGIIGAGLVGTFLVAGLTFAALSIGKRSSSGRKPEMKSLTVQQEEMLTSEDTILVAEENQKLANEKHGLGSTTDQEKDSPASLESTDNISKSALGDETEMRSLSEFNESTSASEASIQEQLQNGSTSTRFPESEDVDSLSTAPSIIDLQKSSALNTSEDKLADIKLSNTSLFGSDEKFLNPSDHPGSIGTTEAEISPVVPESSYVIVSPASIESQASDSFGKDEGFSGSSSTKKDADLSQALEFLTEGNSASLGISSSKENSTSELAQSSRHQDADAVSGVSGGGSSFESQSSRSSFPSIGVPAPSVFHPALQVLPGKVLVPAAVDQAQGQALAALQVLKVIEADAQPTDLCTRREYARWLVLASSALSRNVISKVYPAMYIENVTELAFDDITPEDPDFAAIQGLAEAGLISSKLSRRDMLSSPDEEIGSFHFFPDSPLSRQDLVTWKMALDKKQLPEADKKALHRVSGFIDVDRIDPDACPALVADLSAGEHGIVALAFGYTRLFQPDKPVTKSQAAVALATGEAADIVSEELARIEAESVAENAVAAHSALVAEVEKDINASFEKELLAERQKIDAVRKMAEEASQEVESLRAEREGRNIALMKERAAIGAEMEVLSKLRHELEEQLQSLMSNKVEISYEKERIDKLRKDTEEENQAIARLQYELEVERKALSMARAWAEDEAKKVQERAKMLEEARDHWERHGIKVVVDDNLREESSASVTWLNAGKQLSVEETIDRTENLVDKLKAMAAEVGGKSRDIINSLIQKILALIAVLKERASEFGKHTVEFKDNAVSKMGGSIQELQQNVAGFSVAVKDGTKRVVGDCRGGVEKLTQRFKTT